MIRCQRVIIVAASWLGYFVIGLSTQRPGFEAGSVYVGFAVDKEALG
jgi:hypothetical protein